MKKKDETKAVKLLAQGKSEKEVAIEVGKSQATISRLKSNKREAIEAEISRFISTLPDITQQIMDDIKTSGKFSKVFSGEVDIEDLPQFLIENPILIKQFMELSYKKQADMLRALGVYPSTTPSIFVQNVFHSGSNVVISPAIMTILGEHLKKNLDPIIEAEIVEAEK